ncbi:unnamed protein product, partial [Rotaria sordida]
GKDVVSSQAVQRPMDSSGGSSSGGSNVPGAKHSGSLVTCSDNRQYLVHKGDGYSPSNPTVVTPAENMSSKWTKVGEPSQPNTTVGGMMNNGEYSLIGGKNCNDATAGQPNSNVKTDALSANIVPK